MFKFRKIIRLATRVASQVLSPSPATLCLKRVCSSKLRANKQHTIWVEASTSAKQGQVGWSEAHPDNSSLSSSLSL